jgi:hypothetical protein
MTGTPTPSSRKHRPPRFAEPTSRAPQSAAALSGGLLAQPEGRWAGLALVLFLLGLGLRAVGFGWAGDVFFAGCYISGGWEPGLAGLRALRRSRLTSTC